MRDEKQSKLSMLNYKKDSSKRNKGDKISLNGSVSTHEKKHKHEKKKKDREDGESLKSGNFIRKKHFNTRFINDLHPFKISSMLYLILIKKLC